MEVLKRGYFRKGDNFILSEQNVKDRPDFGLLLGQSLYMFDRVMGSVLHDKEGVKVEGKEERETGCYPNIPSKHFEFLTNLERIVAFCKEKLQINKPKFLDVGCGFGIKSWLAGNLGCEPYGIEINRRYAEVAEQLGITVFVGDGREFADYKDYDIIYWYVPMVVHSKETALEKQIMTNASQTCVLFPFTGHLAPVIRNADGKSLADEWKKDGQALDKGGAFFVRRTHD